MKKIILGLLTLTVFAGYSQAITVNTTTSGATLVNTIFNGTASNISRSSGNGIGSFQNTNPAFPLSSGIVICGGNANSISGTSTMSTTGSGITDSDLQAFSNATGSTGTIQDASFLSFNFEATTSSLSMDYFFASEEYGTYQCGFSDKIAILLTNLTTGVTTNIAVVPQTTTPVSVNTIRSSAYNTGCTSVNAQYFGAYDASNNSSLSGTCFNGRTVLLNASSNLVIGNTYKLKIVIGDFQDSLYDSAIFMKSSLLDTNILGADLTIANNTAVCQGYLTTLSTGLSPSNYVFVWKKDGLVIGTNSSLTVDLPGTYEVEYTNMVTNLTSSDSIIVEYNVAPVLTIINPPSVCSPQTVDITSPNVVIEMDAEGTITYWANAVCTTPIPNPTSIAQSGTYYVKSSNSCGFDVEPVVATIVTTPTLNITNPAPVCFPNTVNLTSPIITIGSSGNGILTYWTNAGCTSGLANPTSVSVSGTYYIKSTISGCSNVAPVIVTVNQAPVISQVQNLIINEENTDGFATFDLTAQIPAILNGQSPNDFQIDFYLTLVDAMANFSPIGNASNYTNTSNFQVIYFTINSLNSGCSVISSFILEVANIPVIISFQDFIVYETSTDGVATFNLTSQIPSIIGVNSNPDDYVVTFFTSYEDAINNINQISNPTSFVNTTNPQTIYVRVTNLGGKLTSTTVIGSMILSVQETLSVSDIDLKTIKISPNPIIDFMTVSAKENINSIAIFNTLGQLVFEKKVNTSEEKIDLTALTSGNYIVKITSETSSKVLKIIKQ